MPKHVKPEEEVKKRKEEEESEESSEEDSDSSSDDSSDSSDNESSDDSSESSDNESSDSSDDSSDDSSEEESKKKPEKKGKPQPAVAQSTKNKRPNEEPEKTQPNKKKVKTEESNGHTNGHSKAAPAAVPKKGEKSTKEVEKWREEHQLTVSNIEDSSNNPTAPFADFADASFPSFITESVNSFAFKKPTPIQAQSWPLTLQGRDIVGIAETGSGKTLAFGYPALIKIKSMKADGPKVLVLAPTRELAQQIHEVIAKACIPAKLSACVVFGGVDKKPQAASIKTADIVIATPGRLIDLLEDKSANLKNVRYLVFDEADRMLDMGFIPQIRTIVQAIPKDADRQTLMFSATWPVDVQKFAHTYLKSPVQITIGGTGEKLTGAKKVSQIVEVIPFEGKRRAAIKDLLKRLCAGGARPKILLFMLYKNTCDALYQELFNDKYSIEILHGGKSQNVRDKAMANFKNGSAHILIATDVAARGLDIKDVKFVINGEMPLVMEDYIHRIGRTGRAGESGSAYTIVSPDDKVHIRQLVRILEEGKHNVPAELAKLAESAPITKPRKSTMELLYGDFAKGADAEQMMKKPTKITFD